MSFVPDTLSLTTGFSYYDAFFQGAYIYDFTNAVLVATGSETRDNCDIPLTADAGTIDSNNNQNFICGFPDGLPAGVWTRFTYRRIGGTPAITDPANWVRESYDWDGQQLNPTGGWYYADQTDVEDLIGPESLRIISNAPGAASDAVTDTVRLQRIGELCDAMMDSELARRFTTPLTHMSDATVLILANINAGMVIKELNKPRVLLTPMPSLKQMSEIDRRIFRAIGDAEAAWMRVKLGSMTITADRAYSDQTSAKVSRQTWSSNRWCGQSCIFP